MVLTFFCSRRAQLLRFATHFVLFCRELGLIGDAGSGDAVADTADAIVARYVKHLQQVCI